MDRDLKAEVAAFLDDPEIRHADWTLGPRRRWRAVTFGLMAWEETIRLSFIYVDPEHRRDGHARAFLEKLGAWADRRRLVLTLDVIPQADGLHDRPPRNVPELRRIYLAAGFVDDEEAGLGAMIRLPKAGLYPTPDWSPL